MVYVNKSYFTKPNPNYKYVVTFPKSVLYDIIQQRQPYDNSAGVILSAVKRNESIYSLVVGFYLVGTSPTNTIMTIRIVRFGSGYTNPQYITGYNLYYPQLPETIIMELYVYEDKIKFSSHNLEYTIDFVPTDVEVHTASIRDIYSNNYLFYPVSVNNVLFTEVPLIQTAQIDLASIFTLIDQLMPLMVIVMMLNMIMSLFRMFSKIYKPPKRE